jgi:DNA-binding NtrC family response regulator
MDERPTVLCIDDDPPVLAAIRRLLRHEPYEVLTTGDPRQVMALVAERKVHLIVADQRMPAMPGTELLKQVRTVSPDTAAIILTGHADLSDIAGAMNDGAVDRLIRKPWDDGSFRTMVRELLERRMNPEEGPAGIEPPAGADPAVDVRHFDCKSALPSELLRDLSDFLTGLAPTSRRAVIVLDHLLQVSAPIKEFLSTLVRQVVRSGVRAALVDGSGTAGAFLELVGGRIPLVVYESTSDISPPRRVLVVEDQQETLEYLRTLIECAGHQCQAVGSVGEALRLLGSERFDLVLLDLILPDADGVEVARYVLEKDLRIPVVAVSGFLDRWGGESYTQMGIRRQVSKPYRAKEILDAIRDS